MRQVALISALEDGEMSIESLAELLRCTPKKVRNAIDGVRRREGYGAIVSKGDNMFCLAKHAASTRFA